MFKKLFLHSFFLLLFLFLTSYFLIHPRVYAYQETTYYIHQDNLGSVVAVTNDATVSAQMDYSSYGNFVGAGLRPAPWDRSSDLSLQQNNGIPTERAYTGQIQDASTSLQYYNARYYDPILSRFISADQMGGGNRYSYVSNNPISSSDPTGNMETADDGGGGGSPATPPNPFAGAKASMQGSVTVGGFLQYIYQYSPAGILSSMVNSAADSVGRNGNYLLHGKGDFGSNVVAATDLLTLGAFRGATTSFNQYGVWSAENPNANFFQRLGPAVSPGVAITGFSASFMGIGQMGAKALGVKAPTYISEAVDKGLGNIYGKYGQQVLNKAGLSNLPATADNPAKFWQQVQPKLAAVGKEFNVAPYSDPIFANTRCGGVCIGNTANVPGIVFDAPEMAGGYGMAFSTTDAAHEITHLFLGSSEIQAYAVSARMTFASGDPVGISQFIKSIIYSWSPGY